VPVTGAVPVARVPVAVPLAVPVPVFAVISVPAAVAGRVAVGRVGTCRAGWAEQRHGGNECHEWEEPAADHPQRS
jgi:hypothetical protein